ncbi:hypothetical protein CROQUDRAFT_653861 [Cronartium quercuum f. sp. fusiforme G11]|uniref:Uncharacterized protein n=1 Tax=Cronartium quercuum f. sp. fusiforme G11 TaxID=708437 RepID=A0A9P6NS76_9BASI|nr:hypothetical protein CROQUDRAFT_653861 [Cronartium quercuum f. sp. fusiforme G11]
MIYPLQSIAYEAAVTTCKDLDFSLQSLPTRKPDSMSSAKLFLSPFHTQPHPRFPPNFPVCQMQAKILEGLYKVYSM